MNKKIILFALFLIVLPLVYARPTIPLECFDDVERYCRNYKQKWYFAVISGFVIFGFFRWLGIGG